MNNRSATKLTNHMEAAGLTDIRLLFMKVPAPHKKKPFSWDYDYTADGIDPDSGERVEFTSYAQFSTWRAARQPEPVLEPRRDVNLIIRATATEKERVAALAETEGQTVSDYIRQRIGL